MYIILYYDIIVKTGGYFVSYKGGDSDEEVIRSEKAITLLGGEIENTDRFFLPDTDMGRTLIKIRKRKSTPNRYPRKAGIPSKEPL